MPLNSNKTTSKQQQTTQPKRKTPTRTFLKYLIILCLITNVGPEPSKHGFGPNVCWSYCLGISFGQQIGRHSIARDVPDESASAAYNLEIGSTCSTNLEQICHSAFSENWQKMLASYRLHTHTHVGRMSPPLLCYRTVVSEWRFPTPRHVNKMFCRPVLRC